ncbi:MAG: excinuclease ABC subunit A, partial [Planctomycetes bacterium]|nr:excinuclease ABC subunit A [Planctomycetota bacterium]
MIHCITLRGVRVHNLRNLTLDIPHRRLVVITGVSGSGKSSLAFDTLYAEGQRRYVESFSAYARQFLERMDKPDVDHVAGILPAVAIERKNPIQNRRSTVGTATEINDFLRLLFARIGRTHCERCGREVAADTVDKVVDRVLALPEGTRFVVAFPLGKVEGAAEDTLLRLTQQGFVRLLLGSEVVDISQKSRPPRKALAKALVVVDRLTVKPDIRDRLADSVATAFQNGSGQVIIRVAQASSPDSRGKDACATSLRFSTHFQCSHCDLEYAKPEPLLFSFNNPLGACPVCQGFGHTIELDMDAVIPDKSRTLEEGAVAPWNCGVFKWWLNELRQFAPRYRIRLDAPFRDLSERERKLVVEGTSEMDGIRGFMRWLEDRKYKMHIRVFLSRYRGYVPCVA